MLSIHSACPGTPENQIACNDDSSTCAANSLQSVVTFAAAANTTYRIRVGGYDADGTGARFNHPYDIVVQGDRIIVVTYGQLPAEEARNYSPTVVLLDEQNEVVRKAA